MAKRKSDFGGFGFTDKMVFGESPTRLRLSKSAMKKARKKGRKNS